MCIRDRHRLYRQVLRRMIIPGKTVQAILPANFVSAEEIVIPDKELKNMLRIDIQAGDRKSFYRHFFDLFTVWEQNQAGVAHIRSWMHELTVQLIKNNILRAESIPYNEGLDEIIWQGDSFPEIRDNLWKEIEEIFIEVHSETGLLKKDEKNYLIRF